MSIYLVVSFFGIFTFGFFDFSDISISVMSKTCPYMRTVRTFSLFVKAVKFEFQMP